MASELNKGADVVACMQVSMQQDSMQQIAVWSLSLEPEIRMRVVFETFSQLAAEADVPARIDTEGNVLDRVPNVGALGPIPKITVVLFETQ